MRIATFNINNVNKRLANLLDWMAATEPDVVCLQELKAEERAFPLAAIEAAGYGAVWRGQRTWNGVAILARGATPVITRRALPGDPTDDQARYIEAAVNGILVASIYLPNGNPQPGPKFAYKLAWFDRLIAHAAELMAAGVPVVLAGDYNVVPTEADIWPGHHEQANALLQPETRAAYQRLLDQGWTDALRALAARGAALDLLGLSASSLAERQRHAARPSPFESASGQVPDRRWRRSLGSGARREQATMPRHGSS